MGILTISDLAREVGLNPPAIRYYEEIGLIPPARRSESGYRMYSEEDVQRLRLIQRAKLLSLSLADIKRIIDYAVDGSCATLRSELLPLLRQKLVETERTIAELVLFHEELSRFCDDLSLRLTSGGEGVALSAEICDCLGKQEE